MGSELAQVLVYIMFKGWVEEVSITEKKGKRHKKLGHASSDKNKKLFKRMKKQDTAWEKIHLPRYICVDIYMCMCMCIYISIYIYIYMYVCVCVCVDISQDIFHI